jgi:archaellum component FlaC
MLQKLVGRIMHNTISDSESNSEQKTEVERLADSVDKLISKFDRFEEHAEQNLKEIRSSISDMNIRIEQAQRETRSSIRDINIRIDGMNALYGTGYRPEPDRLQPTGGASVDSPQWWRRRI